MSDLDVENGDRPSVESKTTSDSFDFKLVRIKARGGGGSRDKKCPILIFQYVIELEKTNKMQKTGG